MLDDKPFPGCTTRLTSPHCRASLAGTPLPVSTMSRALNSGLLFVVRDSDTCQLQRPSAIEQFHHRGEELPHGDNKHREWRRMQRLEDRLNFDEG